ncbi:MAG: hypothetical protein HYV07_01360 [Deltaproteobacteria bacterium]|nr:hypothetical protein [Deltaproteobacteria bacterium]
MDGLIGLHLTALGTWTGIIAVELLYEIAGWRRDLDPVVVARLHRWTDRYLELPILGLVVASGALLWRHTGFSVASDLVWKMGLGLAAVAFNVLCWLLVELRAKIADPEASHRFSARMWLVVSPGFALGIAALALGGQRAGWW